jgi:hypothetical protein
MTAKKYLKSKAVKRRQRVVAATGIAPVIADLYVMSFRKRISKTGGGVSEAVFAAVPIGGESQFLGKRLLDADERPVFRAETAFGSENREKTAREPRFARSLNDFAGVRIKHPEGASSGGSV